jgi:hypothetical protein
VRPGADEVAYGASGTVGAIGDILAAKKIWMSYIYRLFYI